MKLYGIEYRDWAYGEWFFAGKLWAHTEAEAANCARLKFGSLGKSYRAYLTEQPAVGQ